MPDLDQFSLSGKNIIVTGASSGLGRSIAIQSSKAGANVVLVARDEQRLNGSLEMLSPGNHLIFKCDVTDPSRYLPLLDYVKENLGEVSGLVYSAGIERTLPLSVTDATNYDEMMRVNTYPAFDLSKSVLKKKYRAEQVNFVFIASTMGVVGAPALTAYSITKGAIIAGTRSFALEYADKKVRANCISPGHVDGTQMSNDLFEKLSDDAKNDIVNRHPLGLGKPEDVGYACVFLLSDAARWITGTNMIVDGGYCAQ